MNDLVKASTNEVSTQVSAPANTFGLRAEDLLIPKVLLMQAISKAVKDRKAHAGDFFHSLDEVAMAKPLEFMAIGMFRQIVTYENKQKVKAEPWSIELETQLMKEGFFQKDPVIKAGVTVTKSVSLNYYIILTKDIEEMTPFPMVVTFVKTSFKAGKQLSTHIFRLEEFGAKPWAKTFKLGAVEESGDNGDYFVYNVQPGNKSTPEQIAVAEKWANRLKTAVATIHDAEEEGSGEPLQTTAQEADKSFKPDSKVNF